MCAIFVTRIYQYLGPSLAGKFNNIVSVRLEKDAKIPGLGNAVVVLKPSADSKYPYEQACGV